MHCQFAGDENTKDGALIPCSNAAIVKMRRRSKIADKPCVCQKHMELMLSPKVAAKGMDWVIDRFLREPGIE